MDPSVAADFVFDLAGRPAGIAEREDRVLRAAAHRHRSQDVQRRGERHVFRNRQRGVGTFVIAAVEHKAAAGLHGPAVENGKVWRARRHREFELLHEIMKGKAGHRLVDDDAHGAVGRMRAHEDHALFEMWVAHTRHCDQELAFEKIFAATFRRGLRERHGTILARFARLATAGKTDSNRRFALRLPWATSGAGSLNRRNS